MAKVIIPGPNEDQTVDENCSCYLEFDLIDPNDKTGATTIPGTAVTSATLNLTNRSDSTVILTAVDVSADIDGDGHFKHLLTGANNEILDDTDPGPASEDHIATVTIQATAGGDTHDFVKNIRVRVMNLKFVT